LDFLPLAIIHDYIKIVHINWYNTSMNAVENVQAMRRTKAVVAALASVRAEGLQPSGSAIAFLNQYAGGKIDAQQLRRKVLRNAQARNKK
jgi:hypothetical protein